MSYYKLKNPKNFDEARLICKMVSNALKKRNNGHS
jgi:hypothetical protein